MFENNIPKEFKQEDEDYKPHSHCKVCDKELLASNSEYCIEKVVRKVPETDKPQTLFNFAICMDCIEQLRQRISAESMQAIEQFQMRKIMAAQNQEEHNPMYSFYKQRCLFSGKDVAELDSYQMIAFCQGDHLADNKPPMLIGAEVLEETQDLLSAKTRDELDDFTDNNFGWPPEFARLLKNGEVGIF